MSNVGAQHTLHGELLDKRIEIALAGAGGNGSQVLNGLARLDLAMRSLGHPFGLHVTAFDADEVSEANIGRNLWSPADVGANKAVLAVSRLNAYYGLDFDAVPSRYDANLEFGSARCDILISCVDTRQARSEMREMILEGTGPDYYWMDLGNFESVGQIVLGEVEPNPMRLPFVTDLFPEVADVSIPEVNRHSCSLAMSLESQGLFVNDFTSRMALQLLYDLLRKGQIRHCGAMVNLESMRMSPIPIDVEAWRRFGYVPEAAAIRDGEKLAA